MKVPLYSLVVCLLISLSGYRLSAQAVQPLHMETRMGGISSFSGQDGILSMDFKNLEKAFLVIKAETPLRLISAQGVNAKLVPGWDGTLGYKMYGLSLEPEKEGRAEVVFELVQPPAFAIPPTAKEMGQFKEELETRPSRFPGEKSAFSTWQDQYRDSLISTLMGGAMPDRVPAKLEIEYEKEYENFRLITFSYQSKKYRRNKALLSIPHGRKDAPLLVALHGHETSWGTADSAAFREGHIDDFCAYFANRGWAVLQPATMDHHLQYPGWTLQGEWTWDAMCALDLCSAYPSINMDHVAVCGLSTGAHLAMNLLALDPRIKAGVVGCILSTWNHYEKRFRIPPHCDCGISSQLSPVMEQCDWAALAAPKAVLFQHGKQDASFCPGADKALLDLEWNTGILPQEEYNAMFSEIERAYGMYEQGGKVKTLYHDGPHSVDNDAAFEWLNKALLPAR